MRKLRHIALGGSVVTAAVITMGSLSWACTPHAMMEDIQPGRGPAGMTVALRGNHFEARQIEIRLDSSDGRLLGIATGPELNYHLEIPRDLEAGWINIVALSRSIEDPTQLNGQATKPFRITQAFVGEGASTGAPVPDAGGSAPAAATEAAPAPSATPQATAGAPSASTTGAAAKTTAPETAGVPGVPGVAASSTDRPGTTAQSPAVAAAPAGPSAAAGSASAAALGGSGPVVAATPDDRLSRRTATGEAWSSFAGQPAGPGLAADPVRGGDSGGAARGGMILLAVGLAALLATGTTALAQQRRRRKA